MSATYTDPSYIEPYYEGLILSETTSSILGLGPDPDLAPTFILGVDSGVEDAQFMHGGRVLSPSADPATFHQDQATVPAADPPTIEDPDSDPDSTTGLSLLGMFNQAFSNLATKFGYLRKPTDSVEAPAGDPAVNVLGDLEDVEFQCMSDEETPILVDGKPVIVTEPQECHKFFMDFAQFADPEEFFFQAAREVFKSNGLLSFVG